MGRPPASPHAKCSLRTYALGANYPVRLFNGGIAQLVERLVRNEKARGSNPLTSNLTINILIISGLYLRRRPNTKYRW
jgi:hypothetical protein